jgi:hypothetical protein
MLAIGFLAVALPAEARRDKDSKKAAHESSNENAIKDSPDSIVSKTVKAMGCNGLSKVTSKEVHRKYDRQTGKLIEERVFINCAPKHQVQQSD